MAYTRDGDYINCQAGWSCDHLIDNGANAEWINPLDVLRGLWWGIRQAGREIVNWGFAHAGDIVLWLSVAMAAIVFAILTMDILRRAYPYKRGPQTSIRATLGVLALVVYLVGALGGPITAVSHWLVSVGHVGFYAFAAAFLLMAATFLANIVMAGFTGRILPRQVETATVWTAGGLAGLGYLLCLGWTLPDFGQGGWIVWGDPQVAQQPAMFAGTTAWLCTIGSLWCWLDEVEFERTH